MGRGWGESCNCFSNWSNFTAFIIRFQGYTETNVVRILSQLILMTVNEKSKNLATEKYTSTLFI